MIFRYLKFPIVILIMLSAKAQCGQDNMRWENCAQETALSGVSACFAMFPTFKGYVMKTNLQNGVKKWWICPKPNPLEISFVAFVVGIIVAQQVFFEILTSNFVEKYTPLTNYSSAFVACFVSAGISVPLNIVFNGQSFGLPWRKSLSNMCRRQYLACHMRETFFLYSLTVSDKLNPCAGKDWKYQRAMESFSGFMGSIICHPLDSWLTFIQGEKPLCMGTFQRNLRYYYRGSLIRGCTIGGFNVAYQWILRNARGLLQSEGLAS